MTTHNLTYRGGDFLDYIRWRYGPNWVVARRTRRIVERYGADVVCLSPAKYRKAQEDYRAAKGLHWRTAA